MIKSLLIAASLLTSGTALAQMPQTDATHTPSTHNALVSMYALTSQSVGTKFDAVSMMPSTAVDGGGSHKSGLVAALLSLAIPGLGEYYVGDQIWRGAIFTGLEAGLWYGTIHWQNRGDDSTDVFHAYGDAHWSATRYANYLNTLLPPGDSLHASAGDIRTIRRAEDYLDAHGGQNFTHRLPDYKSQQYYELMSKYIQYTAGWDDFTNPQDPTSSAHYQYHADMRERMNYQYEISQFYLWGIFLNHALSAIDAALLAHDHNSQLHLQGDLQQRPYPDGTLGYVPTARIEYRF